MSSLNGTQYLPKAGNCDDACNTTSVYPSGTSGDAEDITSSSGAYFLQVDGMAGGPPFLILFFSGSSVCSLGRLGASFDFLADGVNAGSA